MRYIISAAVLTLVCAQVLSQETGSCNFGKHKDVATNQAIQRLKPLIGKKYSADDNVPAPNGYTYKIGICASVGDDVGKKNAGAIQVDKTEGHVTKMVGNVTQAQIMGGTSWILLEYEGGDTYGSHCNKEARKASIMITCAEGETEGKMKVIEENKNKTYDCYYLFEMEHIAACPDKSASGLSAGSVVVIIFLVVAGIYLLGGFIYQRLFVGAKGMEQLPNFAFWQEFGSLQADGCDFICRCGGKTVASKEYRGIGDDQMGQVDEEFTVDRDDGLLPM